MATVHRASAEFAAIARKLDVIELMNEDGDNALSFTARDFSSRGMNVSSTDAPFLDFYSDAGLKKVLVAYGIDAKLHEKGITEYTTVSSRTDAYHHRLEIFFVDPRGEGTRDDAHRIMDLRVHLVSGTVGALENIPLFIVEWLSMQNPLARFTPERPQLPGQRYPSTGFGRAINNLLIIAAQRLKRHALIHVPERFHLAELYRRGGSRYADERWETKFEAIYDATSKLSFAHRAWAVERGFVKTASPVGTQVTGGTSVRLPAQEMILPLSKEVAEHIEDRGFIKRWLEKATAPKLVFDREGYVRSLHDDPIEGLTADTLKG